MKIERLLGMTIYLLNHHKVTAAELAKRYEVSIRTIQRDIDTLCQAGIPVVAELGSNGGYQILDTFKMERQIACDDDYTWVRAALKGLSTAYPKPQIEETLEKFQALSSQKKEEPSILLDWGIIKEKETINELLSQLEKAILLRKVITFDYTNAQDEKSHKQVEPAAVVFKWYNWYLIAFDIEKSDYRMYKLIRMSQFSETIKDQMHRHVCAEQLIKDIEQKQVRKNITIKMICYESARMKVIEYMNGEVKTKLADGRYEMETTVPEEEHLWFATLMALGNQVEIISPTSLKERILSKCEEILESYKK